MFVRVLSREEWLIIVFWICFYFFSFRRIFNFRNWFYLLFFWTPFSRLSCRSRNFYRFCLFASIFFFLFLDADRILESILFSLSPFFCSIAEFLQFYVFGGENWAFFRSFVAGFDGRIDFIAKRGMKWNSWELRPDGSRFLSHFWKEIRAE